MCGREASARAEAYIPKTDDGEEEEEQQGNELPPPILFQPNAEGDMGKLRHDIDNNFQERFKHQLSAAFGGEDIRRVARGLGGRDAQQLFRAADLLGGGGGNAIQRVGEAEFLPLAEGKGVIR